MPRSTGKKTEKPNGQPKAAKSAEQWDKFFFLVAANGGNVTRACEQAKITRVTVWQKERSTPEFKARLDAAKQLGADFLEDEAIRRAFEGVEEPVGFYMGVSNEVRRNYSDGLMQFMLKALKPDKYKDRSQVDGTQARFDFAAEADLSGLSTDELRQLGSLLSKARPKRGGE